ncbi:ESX-1 associated ATP-binding protein EpsI N-terminal domain-containing protein [Mycobacterium lepromatosis]|uniref:ESX-1 secretion-associated protein EspI n=1 Tax=Mycobacterium lepromatosis TaxID=480418 RepID=A0A0F4ESE3_9MYCO|nr:AAA family ATPase [Mycobacterium lepromatosis]KJX75911.1 ESX-1 secretion-associated protein EspI [Mycobacterium lepromatosis]UKN41445.1 ESX-1 secretion-associated protein EspI [Mycobacterium lepromatosis]
MAADYDKLFRPDDGAYAPSDQAAEQLFDGAPPYTPPTMPTFTPTPNGEVASPMPDWPDQLQPYPSAASKPHLPPMPIGSPVQPPLASSESSQTPLPVSAPLRAPAASLMPIGESQQWSPAVAPEHQFAESEPPSVPMPINGPALAKPATPMPTTPVDRFQRTPVTSPEPSLAEPEAQPPATPKPSLPPGSVSRPQQAPLESPRPSAGQHSRHARRVHRHRDETQTTNLTSATDPMIAPRSRIAEPRQAPHAAAEPAPTQPPARPDGLTSRRTAPHDATATSAIGAQTEQSAGVKKPGKVVAKRGWRHWVHTVTRINLGLSPDELHELDLLTRVRRTPRGSYQIGILGLKGGAGKTTVTVTLGSMFARVRNDRILVVDADTGCGNLADRTGRSSDATIADLLADKEVKYYNDIRAYTSVNTVNLEVLPAMGYSTAQHMLSGEDWNLAAATVSRYYNIMLADCGVGLFDPITRSVLSTASGVVIVTSTSIDAAQQAAVALDWLRHKGYQDLLNRACVVINYVMPKEPNIAGKELVQQFEQQIQPGRVVVLPWDKHIAAGTEIRLDRLDPLYQRRILELAAALSDDFERAGRH